MVYHNHVTPPYSPYWTCELFALRQLVGEDFQRIFAIEHCLDMLARVLKGFGLCKSHYQAPLHRLHRPERTWQAMGIYEWDLQSGVGPAKIDDSQAAKPPQDVPVLLAEAIETLRDLEIAEPANDPSNFFPGLIRFSFASREWCRPKLRSQWEILQDLLIFVCGNNQDSKDRVVQQIHASES